MRGVKIGRKRHLAQIQQDNGGADAIGGNAANWVTVFADVPASLDPVSAREVLQGAQIRPDTTHKVGIRYIAGVHSAMRLLIGTRVFHLTGPPLDTEGVNRELIIEVKEQETTT